MSPMGKCRHGYMSHGHMSHGYMSPNPQCVVPTTSVHTAHHTINLDTNFSCLFGDNSFGAAVLVQLVTAARHISAQTGWNLIWVSKTPSSSLAVCRLPEVLIDCQQCVRCGWVCTFVKPHCATFWFWFQSGTRLVQPIGDVKLAFGSDWWRWRFWFFNQSLFNFSICCWAGKSGWLLSKIYKSF